MKPNEDPTTSEILHRLVVPIQTRGNLGKSTEAIARCEWMSQRGVLWKGYDLDAFNRTLSTTYPENVVFVEPGPEPEGELIKIFRRLAHNHFKGILAAMFMSCLVIMGGCFAYGWWKLSRHYDQMRDAAPERMVLVNKRNEEAFTQLTKLNAPIRVVPTTDSRKRVIPGKFALVMEHAEDVGIEDTPDGKRVAIYFEKSSY